MISQDAHGVKAWKQWTIRIASTFSKNGGHPFRKPTFRGRGLVKHCLDS
jgi:hypothetical protein